MSEAASPFERSASTGALRASDVEEQTKGVNPETSAQTSTWRERFDRHETIFDEGRTFTPRKLWRRLESFEELKRERSKWISERRLIAHGVTEARLERLRIENKLLEGQETKENLAKHEKIVNMLEACWRSAEAHLEYCEKCIEHHGKRAARTAKKREAEQKEEDAKGTRKEEAQEAEEDEEYFTAEE